ncbi:MAG: shikimate dehydrogenase [Dehalococcoidia bacterium]|nr:shikimate dehydrogenase [Dehalococcoidia bacterium]MBF8304047.1 shikimate dehydrogenase [Dehalococcoidia bacterium]
MTKYIGIIGHPLTHSISPVFQQAALDHYGLDIRYQVWEVEKVELGMEYLNQAQSLGANVTVPYKETITPFLDSLESQAWRIGAVNTIVKEDKQGPSGTPSREVSMWNPTERQFGRLKGYNTDAHGFFRALMDDADFDPENKVAVLLGAGGVARAAGFVLVDAGVRSLIILNRNLERANTLAELLNQQAKAPQNVAARAWKEEVMLRMLPLADLIVNCTTLGMKHSPGEGQSPITADLLTTNTLVYDLVYNPIETPLLKEAKKAGARTLSGLSMLVYQGAASFELWTGKEAPLDIMFKSARRALS